MRNSASPGSRRGPKGHRLDQEAKWGRVCCGPSESIRNGRRLKATLVWTDLAGESLQNDLDLVVQASNGEERHGNVAVGSPAFDRANNVEQVDWLGIPSGQVRVTVRAYRVTQGPQTYALVVRMV